MLDKVLLKEDIGKRIQDIRENKMHMTKVKFANLIGMKNQYLGAVECGQRGLTVEKAIEICNVSNVSLDYLLRGIDNSIENYIKEMLSMYNAEDIDKAFKIFKQLLAIIQ